MACSANQQQLQQVSRLYISNYLAVVLTEDADADPPRHPSKSPTEAEKVKKEIKQEKKEKYDRRIANECSSVGKETGSAFCQAPPVRTSVVSFRSF